MTDRISRAALLLTASFGGDSVSASTIELSDVRITARATFSSQRVPEKSDFDVKVAPPDQLLQAAEALVIDGLPFPNQPNSQNAGFASSAGVVGGVFGVAIGGLFAGESMFYRTTDASKAALVFLTQHLRNRGYELFDVQWTNAHTRRLGAINVPRTDYLARLSVAVQRPVRFGP